MNQQQDDKPPHLSDPIWSLGSARELGLAKQLAQEQASIESEVSIAEVGLQQAETRLLALRTQHAEAVEKIDALRSDIAAIQAEAEGAMAHAQQGYSAALSGTDFALQQRAAVELHEAQIARDSKLQGARPKQMLLESHQAALRVFADTSLSDAERAVPEAQEVLHQLLLRLELVKHDALINEAVVAHARVLQAKNRCAAPPYLGAMDFAQFWISDRSRALFFTTVLGDRGPNGPMGIAERHIGEFAKCRRTKE